MKIAAYLEQRGWQRISLPADALNECGAETRESICGKLARWEKTSPYRGPLCAQHAVTAQANLDRA